ncbi:uncharacterized protein LOC123441505 [Hordeum vulgare subsp. vulgare]|uniref:uncharacterized protein LOC123441505 n=1 Tax=Hordeum vulgare subsp. vulgare TaxID=112509 RepID=UPI001D1A5339|nr:uncharacterized protein LOC123441505 [Hordeum vulgare subsp. vulgare]
MRCAMLLLLVFAAARTAVVLTDEAPEVLIGSTNATWAKGQAYIRELEEVKLLKNLSHPNIVVFDDISAKPSGRGWERCGTSTWLWNYIALHYSEISPEIKVLEPSSAAIVDVVSMMSGRCGGMGATSQPCQSTTAELSYNTMCISYYLMKLVTNMVCVSYYSQSSNVVMWSLHIINLWCVHLYQVFRVHRSPGVHISKVKMVQCITVFGSYTKTGQDCLVDGRNYCKVPSTSLSMVWIASNMAKAHVGVAPIKLYNGHNLQDIEVKDNLLLPATLHTMDCTNNSSPRERLPS